MDLLCVVPLNLRKKLLTHLFFFICDISWEGVVSIEFCSWQSQVRRRWDYNNSSCFLVMQPLLLKKSNVVSPSSCCPSFFRLEYLGSFAVIGCGLFSIHDSHHQMRFRQENDVDEMISGWYGKSFEEKWVIRYTEDKTALKRSKRSDPSLSHREQRRNETSKDRRDPILSLVVVSKEEMKLVVFFELVCCLLLSVHCVLGSVTDDDVTVVFIPRETSRSSFLGLLCLDCRIKDEN